MDFNKTNASIPTTINLRTLQTDPFGNLTLQIMFFCGVGSVIFGTTSRKIKQDYILLGIGLFFISAYGLGWLI